MGKRTGIMLAYPFEERRLTEPKFGWSWPVIVQPKLDGERCRAIYNNGVVTLLSSEENEFTQLPHITNAILDLGAELDQNFELDGELYCHDMSFPEIHSIASRRVDLHPNYKQISYYVFDIINDNKTISRMRESYIISRAFGPGLELVLSFWASDLESIMDLYKDCISEGYEGIIVRDPLSPYVRKRSTMMMKFKPKAEDVYQILRIETAISKQGTPLDMVGRFIVSSPSSGDEFAVGAGCLSHKDRVRYWTEREELIGKELLVQYQHTQGMKPRFALAVEVLT